MFESLTGMDRYSMLNPILTAPSETTLQRRIARAIAELDDRVREERQP